MWTTFKVFIEFVTVLLLFYVLGFFWPWGTQDLSSATRDRTHTPFIEGRVLTSVPLGKSLAHILMKKTEYLQLPPFQVPLPHWNGSAWYSVVHEADQKVCTMFKQGVKLLCSPLKDKLLILYHLPCWLEVEISYFPGEKPDTNTTYYGGWVNYGICIPGIIAAFSINISLSLG